MKGLWALPKALTRYRTMRSKIKAFEAWIKALNKDDKIALLHHTDPDGVSAAVIMNKVVERIRGRPVQLRLNQKSEELFITDATYRKIQAKKINKVIIVDMSVDQPKDGILEKIQKFADVLVIDHHKLYRDMNLIIKPQMFSKIDPASYCCSKLCYDLCKKLVDISDLDWIASLGIIGDCAYDQWKGFIHRVSTKYRIRITKNVLLSKLGKITELLFFTEAYSTKKIGLCFDTLNNAQSYKDVLDSPLRRYKKFVKAEIEYWQNNVRRLAKVYPKQDLIFDFIKPQYPIKAAISTIMSYKYPHKTVIIAQDMNKGFIQLSARRRDKKIAVNTLLEKATQHLKGAKGGGHATSAGGVLRTKDLYAFKENVLKLLSK
jgi:single-stranded DNA-specific DHH superfamily exonuclease